MTRKECLDAAASWVLRDRQNQYGGPENNFERIAQMWNGYLGTNSIKPWDVAAMMGMLKMARARFNPKYADNWVDMAGYAACGIECATAQEEFDKALDKHQQEIFDRMFNKAGGNHPEIPDSSLEFKPGDKVQANIGPNGEWEDMVYYCKDFAGNHLVGVENAVSGGDILYVADAVRSAPNADEESKFKPGDRVQYRVELSSVSDWIWRDATYIRRAFDWQEKGRHIVSSDDLGPITVEDKDIRPAPKAEEEPKFKHGDRVQFRDEIPSTSEPHWFDGTYVERLPDGGHAVKFGPHNHVIHCSDKEIRLAPKEAEGCEDLVYDAPQTKEELMERIKSVNPAIYGAHLE